jgi:hypothetical protein
MGAYEFIPRALDTDSDGLPDWWEWEYSHTMTNMNPEEDNDWDHAANVSEYIAGTDPTRASSFLGMGSLGVEGGGTGLVVRWSSVADRFYTLERATNLCVGFDTLVGTNIAARPPTNDFTDTNVPAYGPYFYRVRVQ